MRMMVTESDVQAGSSATNNRQSEEGCASEHIENISPTAAEAEHLDLGASPKNHTIDRRLETVAPVVSDASASETVLPDRTPTGLQAPPSPPSSIDTTRTCERLIGQLYVPGVSVHQTSGFSGFSACRFLFFSRSYYGKVVCCT